MKVFVLQNSCLSLFTRIGIRIFLQPSPFIPGPLWASVIFFCSDCKFPAFFTSSTLFPSKVQYCCQICTMIGVPKDRFFPDRQPHLHHSIYLSSSKLVYTLWTQKCKLSCTLQTLHYLAWQQLIPTNLRLPFLWFTLHQMAFSWMFLNSLEGVHCFGSTARARPLFLEIKLQSLSGTFDIFNFEQAKD